MYVILLKYSPMAPSYRWRSPSPLRR